MLTNLAFASTTQIHIYFPWFNASLAYRGRVLLRWIVCSSSLESIIICPGCQIVQGTRDSGHCHKLKHLDTALFPLNVEIFIPFFPLLSLVSWSVI